MGETNEFSDHKIIDTFRDFFQQRGRFSGSQDLIVAPKPAIPILIKTDKVISTNQLYEKFGCTVARGLFSIQALAALNIYYGGSTEISRQNLTEFLHNMSHQALKKDNYNDRMAELINELIFMLLDRNNRSLNIGNAINNNINDEINYRFTFDFPTETEIQKDMEDIKKTPKNQKRNKKKTKKKIQRHLLPMFHHHYSQKRNRD